MIIFVNNFGVQNGEKKGNGKWGKWGWGRISKNSSTSTFLPCIVLKFSDPHTEQFSSLNRVCVHKEKITGIITQNSRGGLVPRNLEIGWIGSERKKSEEKLYKNMGAKKVQRRLGICGCG